jgi:ubiquitin carboxyl-terminal hydrolase L3
VLRCRQKKPIAEVSCLPTCLPALCSMVSASLAIALWIAYRVFLDSCPPSLENRTMSKQKWFPLESNPSLMNGYVAKLGFNTDLYEFVDVFSTEDWALQMIPQPVVAVLMLYPLTEKQESFYGQDNLAPQDMDKVWFTKQRIGNACGTIGLLHTLLNVPEPLRIFPSDSWLHGFLEDCPNPLDPVRKADILERDAKIAKLHDQATSAENNQTDRGNLDDQLVTHFVALVNVNDQLYELDGRKEAPVAHGPTTSATLLADACKVVQTFMQRDPDEVRFTILALAPKQE